LQCILANFQTFSHVNYLLLLQDDAQPIDDDFHVRFLSLVDNRIRKQWPLNGIRQQPAFIKVYHPRWLLDYLHPSVYIVVQLLATSVFLTSILFMIVHIVISMRQVRTRREHFRIRTDETTTIVTHACPSLNVSASIDLRSYNQKIHRTRKT
jgi:hypothetical protein